MTNDAPPTNPLIESLIAHADRFSDEIQAHGPPAYEMVTDLLERIQYDPVFSGRYSHALDQAENIIKTDLETDNPDVLVLCLEQLLDDMDDLEENCNE